MKKNARHHRRAIEWRPPSQRSAGEWEAFERNQDWEFIGRIFRTSRLRSIPRRLRTHPTWRTLVNLGTVGALEYLLNDGISAPVLEFGKELARILGAKPASKEVIAARVNASRLTPAVGRLLAQLLEEGSWLGLQIFLLERHPLATATDSKLREMWKEALKESILFERCGFVVAWCAHKQHYYLSDDRRRKDCPWHRLAGQQARWRQRHPAWKLRRGRPRRAKGNRATVSGRQ